MRFSDFRHVIMRQPLRGSTPLSCGEGSGERLKKKLKPLRGYAFIDVCESARKKSNEQLKFKLYKT